MNAANEYARLLMRLHRMWLKGKDGSEEADALRDQMDSLWVQLAESEIAELREYAAELNEFNGVASGAQVK